MAKFSPNPPASIEAHPTDVKLTEVQLHKLSLFSQLKQKPSLEKFPGALVLRRYQKGEVIFRQGEAGWTALYILTSEDMLAVLQFNLDAVADENRKKPLRERIAMMEQYVKQLKAVEGDDERRQAATVNLAIPRQVEGEKAGLLHKLRRRLLGRAAAKSDHPQFIPIDAPRGIDYNTLQAPLYEGELFGEMSCLYGTPRSATVVATRTCFMLEMLRNIFDQLQKDPAYKAQMDKVYKKRVLQLQLRQLVMFSDLNEAQLNEVREGVELVSYETGQLICDEHDRADSMYVIRSGLVRVVKKVSPLVSSESIRNWPALCAALRDGEKKTGEAHGKIWQLLGAKAKAALSNPANQEQLPAEERQEVLYALNDLVKDRKLSDAKEFQDTVTSVVFRERTKDFPEKRPSWTEHDVRRYNRMLLEALYPGIIRTFRRRVGPDCVLYYGARGEFIGEMGLMMRQPRDASYLACGHPQDVGAKKSGRVELIRIPEALFHRLMEMSPASKEKVEKKIAERAKQMRKQVGAAVWDDESQVLLSSGFEKLGLIQGQRLMLIDLDRCTRCDECVRACVNTHTDGRSRLFLDGPRFGKYMVPTTCRSCLDPVCMIGCPVGSIHRGDNLQIIIENWCIGCGLCSNQCPYGSIQMHDIGVIGEGAQGWRYVPATAVADAKWQLPGYSDHRWALGAAPFHYDREFRDLLTHYQDQKEKNGKAGTVARDRSIYFRYEFRLADYLARPEGQFKLEVTSTDPALTVWLNGREVKAEKCKSGKSEYAIPPKPEAAAAEGASVKPPPATEFVRAGKNVLAIKLTPNPASDAVLLDARLDEIRRPVGATGAGDDVTQKIVTEQAVVCDLCSNSRGQVPACVNACPHEAAMRVDARFEFPVK